MPSPARAFTLIELLIVVAIIAILAAIAVPNFLEAQTRARVSRAHTDLRTIATAWEAYRVDNNGYPHTASVFPLERRYSQVTTPIAYLTSIPLDVFGDPTVAQSDFTGNNTRYRVHDVITFPLDPGASENLAFRRDLEESGFPRDLRYYIASKGPDRLAGLTQCCDFPTFTRRGTGISYDPTNGTISVGDIIRIGPGNVTR